MLGFVLGGREWRWGACAGIVWSMKGRLGFILVLVLVLGRGHAWCRVSGEFIKKLEVVRLNTRLFLK